MSARNGLNGSGNYQEVQNKATIASKSFLVFLALRIVLEATRRTALEEYWQITKLLILIDWDGQVIYCSK